MIDFAAFLIAVTPHTNACATKAPPTTAETTVSESKAPIFVDRSTDLGIAPVGQHAAWCDVNDDGWPDLRTNGALWINRAGKSFTRVDAPGDGVIADLDNDGVGDLV